MAIILNDNIQANLGKPIENKYLNPTLNIPYSSVTEVNNTIVEGLRFEGLTVNINNEEYWYENGVTDGDLVVKIGGVSTNVTGATNGLSVENGNVILGGTLSGNTTIGAGGYSLAINDLTNGTLSTTGASGILDLNAKSNSQLVIKSQSGTLAGDDFTSGVGFNLDYNSNLFSVTDNRATAAGLQYVADYSLDYTDRSLVDKAYVDAIASGLDPKDASIVATTASDGNIDISGGTFVSGTTLDGIVVQDGWRVLIKNQSNIVENGIYDYSASASGFTRSGDFNGDPVGEVSQGSFTFIVTGNTLSSTSWLVTTLDPITVGITEINFTIASKLFDLVEGTGTTVSIVGGNRSVSIELATNSGLDFDSNSTSGRLRVGSTIAGTALTLSSGVLAADVVSGGTMNASTLELSRTISGDITVDLSQFDNVPTTASNGLTKTSNNIVLGGTLTGNTEISTNDSHSLRIGYNTLEGGANSLAIGSYTKATGKNSLAIGGNTCSNAYNSFAGGCGYNGGTVIAGENSIAFGYSYGTIKNHPNGAGSLAMGSANYNNATIYSRGSGSLAMGSAYQGSSIVSYTTGSLAMGSANYNTNGGSICAGGSGSFAMGYVGGAKICANGSGSFAMGNTTYDDGINDNIFAGGVSSLAFGRKVCSTEDFSVSFGRNIKNTVSTGLVFGYNNNLGATNNCATILGTGIKATGGTNYQNHLIINAVAIWDTPSVGTTSDSVLVRNPTTGIVKTVANSELGDANNIYNITGITSSTLTTAEYVVLVQTSGTTQTITLPSSPINGQAYKIKDMGNALTNNIIVNGNGNIIDGAPNATINTDYGALEIVYSLIDSEWYSLAFIN